MIKHKSNARSVSQNSINRLALVKFYCFPTSTRIEQVSVSKQEVQSAELTVRSDCDFEAH
jgi:hypothetical protein